MGNTEIVKKGEYEEQLNALISLLKDTQCFDDLDKWISKSNVFDILSISRTEIRHSNMLAWLLNPNENHGLGSFFLYDFISSFSDRVKSDNIIKLLLTDLNQVNVYREWNHIDILITIPNAKTVIAIENKIGSHEHKAGKSDVSQLVKYSSVLNKHYTDYNKLLIFLTPEGEDATASDWITYTYSELISVLNSVYWRKKDNLGEVERILISNYIETIKKDVIMDDELVTICNDIYNKHKKALDLIFECRNDATKMVSDACKTQLDLLANTNNLKVDSSTKSSIKFRTDCLKSIMRSVDENCYYYVIEVRPSNGVVKIRTLIVFHQDKNNVFDNNVIDLMNKFIDKNKIDSTKSWEWKSSQFGRTKIMENADDDAINDWLKSCLDLIHKQESHIINESK